ncbi:hypothetical protein [Photobacterium leiognathi]|uniref:hypothetical protein n=1 Tax=Photobacterium leiognathi TaxID=553611 RepID=UPI002981273C|nr:hypothetical protein [Photobacterium leiognathi]
MLENESILVEAGARFKGASELQSKILANRIRFSDLDVYLDTDVLSLERLKSLSGFKRLSKKMHTSCLSGDKIYLISDSSLDGIVSVSLIYKYLLSISESGNNISVVFTHDYDSKSKIDIIKDVEYSNTLFVLLGDLGRVNDDYSLAMNYKNTVCISVSDISFKIRGFYSFVNPLKDADKDLMATGVSVSLLSLVLVSLMDSKLVKSMSSDYLCLSSVAACRSFRGNGCIYTRSLLQYSLAKLYDGAVPIFLKEFDFGIQSDLLFRVDNIFILSAVYFESLINSKNQSILLLKCFVTADNSQIKRFKYVLESKLNPDNFDVSYWEYVTSLLTSDSNVSVVQESFSNNLLSSKVSFFTGVKLKSICLVDPISFGYQNARIVDLKNDGVKSAFTGLKESIYDLGDGKQLMVRLEKLPNSKKSFIPVFYLIEASDTGPSDVRPISFLDAVSLSNGTYFLKGVKRKLYEFTVGKKTYVLDCRVGHPLSLTKRVPTKYAVLLALSTLIDRANIKNQIESKGYIVKENHQGLCFEMEANNLIEITAFMGLLQFNKKILTSNYDLELPKSYIINHNLVSEINSLAPFDQSFSVPRFKLELFFERDVGFDSHTEWQVYHNGTPYKLYVGGHDLVPGIELLSQGSTRTVVCEISESLTDRPNSVKVYLNLVSVIK